MRLALEQASSAEGIQRAIDELADTGGTVVLPEMDLEIDRGLELRSGVTLAGQGANTVLRMAPARIYPLAGYHNYGMCDVPLEHTEGLRPGMTVAVRDQLHGGFFETLARITWVEGNWVGLDEGVASDYHADQEPVLMTSFPMIFGRGVEDVAIRDLTLDGDREHQSAGIGSCRGAAVYFIHSRRFEVRGVVESGFHGEGLGFQMCRDVRIQECTFNANVGNGYHPGAGSTAALFENCVAEGNGAAGFFFCVRANHISVRACTFAGNVACGLSVGTRDCHNLIEDCRIADNAGPGILFRRAPRPGEVHSCHVRGCQIVGNAQATGRGQIAVLSDAHDLIFEDNHIVGQAGREQAGIYLSPAAERIWLADNQIDGCFPHVIAPDGVLAAAPPTIACGLEAVKERHYRHLPPGAG
jgi:hypothetical protein